MQAALRAQPGAAALLKADRDHIQRLLQQFESAMESWQSQRLFKRNGAPPQQDEFQDRSRVSFISNPDADAVHLRIERECQAFLRESVGTRRNDISGMMSDPICWNHAQLTLGAQTHAALTPRLIRITDLQMNIDALLICAAYAKRQWMKRWKLDASDDAEFLFRATIAAEIVGIETLGYEIPADRRAEAEWVKKRANRRMFHRGGDDQARRLAEARWYSLAQHNYQAFADEREDRPFGLVYQMTVTKHRDLAGPIDRLRRVFGGRRPRYLHSTLYSDYYL